MGVVVKVDSFGREKQDGWAQWRKERVKDSEGIFSPPPSLFPASLFSSCEGQAWRGCGLAQRLCTAPCSASHRNPINHWSRSLTPGHKDPTHTATYTCTCQHTNIMNTYISACACEGKRKKTQQNKTKNKSEDGDS